MATDAEIVGLCAAIYSPPTPGFWDHYWDGSAPDGICAGIKNNSLIFRGSVTRIDWIRDFEVIRLGAPKEHPQFGTVHAGMDEYLDEFTDQAFKFLDKNASFGGHSLGAGRAWGAAGRYILAGGSPNRISVYGSPKFGCAQFGQFVAPYTKASFRNGLDPVTEVPLWIGTQVAVEPVALQALNVVPSDWSEGFMAWHNINLYNIGVAKNG